MAKSAATAQPRKASEGKGRRGRHPGRQTERVVCAVTPEERDAVYGMAATRGESVSELLYHMSVEDAVKQWAKIRAEQPNAR